MLNAQIENVVDFMPFWNRANPVVRVRVTLAEDFAVQIDGLNSDLKHNFSRLRDAHTWLTEEGYSWVLGSNGTWTK